MVKQTYPHVNINVQDNSAGSLAPTQTTPLHKPFFFLLAENGPVGVPYYGQYADQVALFGSNTFNVNSSLFQHSTVFAKAAAQAQPIFVIRLADDTVTSASLVLEAVVTQELITQYQVDVLGAPILNSSGAPIPLLQVDGVTPVTQPGVSIAWQVRPLLPTETYTNIATTTAVINGNTVTTYPILADVANNPGAATNRSGWSFYYTPQYDTNLVAAINSMTYRFAPVILSSTNTGTTSMIYDSFNANYNDVSLKAVAIDPTTNQDVSLNGILANNYVGVDSIGNPTDLLDYTVYVYSANVGAIGQQIITLSPELNQTMDPFLINIMTAVDANGNPYHHAIVATSSAQVLNQSVVNYHTGGTNGVLTKAAFETLVAAFCQVTVNPDFQDYFRYPFTNFYDSGFSLATKYAIAGLFSLRDDIKIDFSTQDVANVPNTSAQDQSAGAAILATILLYPESVLYGTDAMRASIYQQVGLLASSANGGYTNWVPCTYDRMLKRSVYDNGSYIKGTPKGRPNSEVSEFKKISWTEASQMQKQLNWDTALNTIGYADMTTLFYSDLRSVYSDLTSLLSDDVFVDYLVYLKHIARDRWTYYAGKNTPIKNMASIISKDIDSVAAKAFNGLLPTTTTVYQTAADLQNGFSTTISIAVTGTMPERIWNVIIPVSRAA